MISYKVQPGDMLGVLAVKYKTTIHTLMMDNPIIQSNQKLEPGWILKIYTPQENAFRQSETAYESIETVHSLETQIETSAYFTDMPKEPIYYKDRLVLDGQIAFVKTTESTSLMEVQPNGFIKIIRTLDSGTILGVYEAVTLNGDDALIVDGYHWIYDSATLIYDEIPQTILDGKIRLDSQSKLARRLAATSSTQSNTSAGYGQQQNKDALLVKPQSFIGFGTPPKYKANVEVTNIPIFEEPNYKRPIMQLKDVSGNTTTIELRMLGFSASYSNAVTPSSTNAGWMINVRAPELPVLNINGYLLETKASNEFNDFMTRYHKYLEATKTNDYYSLGVSTLFYKQTEYKGIVVSFAYSETPDEKLHRKYSMQMLVLKEKNLSSSDISKLPTAISRKGYITEADFRSDLRGMLANPITGKFNTDSY